MQKFIVAFAAAFVIGSAIYSHAQTNITVSPTPHSVTLTWTDAVNTNVTYNVYRANGICPGASYTRLATMLAAKNYIDSAVTPGSTYCYAVTAESAQSNTAQAAVPPDTPVMVTVAPPSVTLTSGGTQQFTATVTGTTNTAVVWSLSAPVGTVSQTGLYAAPATVTTPAVITATAASAADSTQSGSATITLTAPPPPPSTATAAFGFNEGTSTRVTDSSGNNLTGTLYQTLWTKGEYGNGLSFNGSSAFVDLGNPSLLQLTGSATWSAWVNVARNPADDGQIIAKSGDTDGWQLKISPDTGVRTFAITVSSGTAHVQRYSKTVYGLNTWYYVAGVYNAAQHTLDIYVNGIQDDGVLRGTIPGVQNNSAVNVNVGRRTGGFYFPGIIDEVRIYNRALSQPEIQSDMSIPIRP